MGILGCNFCVKQEKEKEGMQNTWQKKKKEKKTSSRESYLLN